MLTLNSIDDILAKIDPDVKLLDHTRDVLYTMEHIAHKFGLCDYDVNTLRMAAIGHDLGKSHLSFQKRLRGLEGYELSFRHELTSAITLLMLGVTDPNVILPVLYHHKALYGDPNNPESSKKSMYGILMKGFGRRKKLDSAVIERHTPDEKTLSFIKEVLDEFGIDYKEDLNINVNELLPAYLYKGKHIHKGLQKYLGLLFAADHYASANIEINKNELTLYDKPERVVPFFPPTEKYPLSMKDTYPSINSIVIAPTGAGKTDTLLKLTGERRKFFTLPFKSSINSMVGRLSDAYGECNVRHSDAFNYVFKNGGYVAAKNIKNVGHSVNVLTPHQLFSIVFCVKGWEKLITDLRGASVIFDEIHIYDKKTFTVICMVIDALINVCDCTVHIGTATLPSEVKKYLKSLIGDHQTLSLNDKQLAVYDRVKTINAKKSDVNDIVKNHLDKNILIVCNTISSAFETYKALEDGDYGGQMVMFHSQFRNKDRAKIEEEIQNVDPSNPKIVVATQVVEVSLDIDYDVMLTEIAPIDSLVQRFGRVNRKGLKKLCPIYLLHEEEPKWQMYPSEIIEKTKDALATDGVFAEIDSQDKIDYVYGDVNICQDTIDTLPYKGVGRYTIDECNHKPKSTMVKHMEWRMSSPSIMEKDLEICKSMSILGIDDYLIPLSVTKLSKLNPRVIELCDNKLEVNVIPNYDHYDKYGYCKLNEKQL